LTSRIRRRGKILVRVNFNAYPVQASLGVLGRKWALLVLMNIAFGRARRFNDLLRSAPGMSKRILAMRLRELETDGFLAQAESPPGRPRWQITAKGTDVLPVLLTLIHFGSKWHASGLPIGGATDRPIEVTFAGSGSKAALGPSNSPSPNAWAAVATDDRTLEVSRGGSGKRAKPSVR
jgi:DNA-binding HxlR family transcriptional regulator